MIHYRNTITISFFSILLLLATVFTACEEDEVPDNQSFSSENFRVLKVTTNEDDNISGSGNNVAAFGLNLEVTFSHPVNQDALESSLALSNNGSFSTSYDETGSILTMNFNPLDYETNYTLSLPEGSYGSGGEALSSAFELSFTTAAFVPPNVSLSLNPESVTEGETAQLIVSLNNATTEEVTVNLAFNGAATQGDDYTVDFQSVTIPVGQTADSIAINTIDDEVVDGEEAIEVSITEVTNGVEDGEQAVNLALLDNDLALGLEIKGVLALLWDGSGNNGGKAVHLKATEDIPDLSVYAIGVANNGGGSDSIEFRLPEQSASAGDDILLAREPNTLGGYFGNCLNNIEIVIQTDAMNQNGDDAIELYSATTVIETYGDVNIDGTGTRFEYSGSWAYKLGGEYVFGGLDCAAGSTSTQDSDCTYPLCAPDIQLQGVMSFEVGPGTDTDRERAIHLRANADVEDLSIYGVGISNNGGGSDGLEFNLAAVSVEEGDHILVIRDDDVNTIGDYLGGCIDQFDVLLEDPGINFNGDDGVELYENMVVIETYGNVQDDGTGLFWEYTGSWAYKEFGDTFTYGGADCAFGAETNATSPCPYAFCK